MKVIIYLFALIALLLALLIVSNAHADDAFTVPFQTAKTIKLCLRDETDNNKFYNSADFTASPCASSACCKYSIDGGSWTSCTNQPTADARKCYNFTIPAAELTGGETAYSFEDQSGTKRFADKMLRLHTYGGPNAFHRTPQIRRD